ncbi:hypothetical protein EJ06DRAFT_536925 [Trichodelitschia bisporula]|uniref:Uncharacterized protein n=1 Tax=Trichodelitschia bisporula TaxID=703511 RepID=A0A6G1I2J5_9PEZI|nr:hypothetical protein EJ06DRAFT_536925 [Trichodelitschia bisporula]
MHIAELQTKVDQLASDKRALQDEKLRVEQLMISASQERETLTNTVRQATDAIASRDQQIQEKDVLIAELRKKVEVLQAEVAKLKEDTARLAGQNQTLANAANEQYASLQTESAHAHAQWAVAVKALDELRAQHDKMSSGMGKEMDTALADRNEEIERLQGELADAVEQIKDLQQQILLSKQGESFLTVRDEDYFDEACQKLCQHVQQWVLRFSKFSDTRACRLSSDIRDEKLEERLDDAILDGTDVDMLLADRVRRRDVFMSLVMSMVWEYVFTRYLFGMDRDQRQTLKKLEKTLTEVGPQRAVAQWRAITLTLLSRRESFAATRKQDTEAIVQEIYVTLSKLLPPPAHLVKQITDSLRKVMNLAVELAIEMRCQRAEYIMLAPLRPEFDDNGDLVQKVSFNASLMNERSGDVTSNEELESRQAVVKIVLFPLVVKKGNDYGEGDDEIVVCPAQVLIAKPNSNKKVVRVMSGAMDIDKKRSMASMLPESHIG